MEWRKSYGTKKFEFGRTFHTNTATYVALSYKTAQKRTTCIWYQTTIFRRVVVEITKKGKELEFEKNDLSEIFDCLDEQGQ